MMKMKKKILHHKRVCTHRVCFVRDGSHFYIMNFRRRVIKFLKMCSKIDKFEIQRQKKWNIA